MLKNSISIFGFITLVTLIFACGTTPYYENSAVNQNWSRSYETAIFNQLLNPDADKNLSIVSGLDGTAGQHNVDKYKNSFKKEEQKEITNILKLQ